MTFDDIQEITPDDRIKLFVSLLFEFFFTCIEILVSYPLNLQNFVLTGSKSVLPDGNVVESYYYNVTLPNTANISIHLMTFTNSTTIPFGNTTISVSYRFVLWHNLFD